MAEPRTPRNLETRTTTERTMWTPPEHLPAPNPEPGYTYRWIRVSMMGTADPMNLSGRLREGWVAVKASDHPEIQIESNSKGQIEFGGLILCKTPTEFVEQRQEYYANHARRQMESVDNNFMRENDPRMPLFNERRTKVTFGEGS